jgi:thioredoxin 1
MVKALYFTATWCAPCRTMKPVFENVVNQFSSVEKEYIDIEDFSELVQEYGVRSVPTIVFLKDDEIVAQVNGTKPENLLFDIVNKIV